MLSQVSPDPAQLNRCNAQIRCDVILWNLAFKLWVLLPEQNVVSGGIVRNHADVMAFLYNPLVFHDPKQERFKTTVFFKQITVSLEWKPDERAGQEGLE